MNLIFLQPEIRNMTKITKEVIMKFVQANPIELRCTHAKLCVPIIDRLYRKMKGGINFLL